MKIESIDLRQQFVAACLVVKQGNQTLILRRLDWGDKICFPGGKQELGERADDAVVREFLEETGLFIDVKDIILLGSQFREKAKGEVVFFGAEFNKCKGIAAIQEPDKHSFVGLLGVVAVIDEVCAENIARPVLRYLRQ